MKRAISFLSLGLLLVLAGCSASKTFYDSCSEGSDCPDGWVCPDPNKSGNGTVGGACTPVCEDDADCKRITNREDVSCYRDFCVIDCSKHSDCPESQPICRGANASCADESIGQLWCATEDFSCDF